MVSVELLRSAMVADGFELHELREVDPQIAG
jgi:hypothetical protein